VAEVSEPVPERQPGRANEDGDGQRAPFGRPHHALPRKPAPLFCFLALDPACMPRPIALLRSDEILEPPIILIEVLGYRRDNVFRPGDLSLSEFNRIETVAGTGHEDVPPGRRRKAGRLLRKRGTRVVRSVLSFKARAGRRRAATHGRPGPPRQSVNPQLR